MSQVDLEGEEIEKEVIESTKTVFHGKFFCVSVTESGQDALDKLNDAGSKSKVRLWIAKHMKVKETLTAEEEGMCFQDDLERFAKIL